MASLSRDAGGRVTIQFVHPRDKKRRSIRAGKLSDRDGQALKRKVEDLAAATGSGLTLDADTQGWLARIGDELRDKLVAVGLVEASTATAALKPFLDAYIAGRTDAAPNTLANLNTIRVRLVKHFGARRDLRRITPADADGFRLWLLERYAEATVGRSIRYAQQLFRHALRSRLIHENPFAGLKCPPQTNKERLDFISREQAAKVLQACPNTQWRLVFALARFGGLRCPSELLPLAWSDVDWERERFRVDSPKTGERFVPIFPELRPHLEQAFEEAEPGAVAVVTICRDAAKNMRTHLCRLIRKAGLVPWERPFQNLRATRETELAAEYPLHVVTAWIGNTALVAQKHYLQVTDADFQRAAKSGAVALQKPVQQGAAPSRRESQDLTEDEEDCELVRSGANVCKEELDTPVVRIGVEPMQSGFVVPTPEIPQDGLNEQSVTQDSNLHPPRYQRGVLPDELLTDDQGGWNCTTDLLVPGQARCWLRYTLSSASGAGIEPTPPGSEPGVLPINYPEVCLSNQSA